MYCTGLLGIQPTYEELKLFMAELLSQKSSRIQPTYEELKLLAPENRAWIELVSSLPMRN